jgi:hypothetical protein
MVQGICILKLSAELIEQEGGNIYQLAVVNIGHDTAVIR